MKRCFILLSCLSLLCASIFCTSVSADDPITVRVGIYENEPKIFTDDQGNASGFWPDIIEYIASEEGWQVEYVHGTWAQCLDRLENNEIDIMPDVAYSQERSTLYDFSGEFVYSSWSRVYMREGVDIQSILDLEGKDIAVLKGSVNVEGPEGIKILANSFGVSCNFIEVDSYNRVFELVESDEVDAGVTSKDFGSRHIEEYNIIRTSIIFQPSLLYFAFPKGSSLTPYLIERVDYHIEELKADENSVYYQSLEEWLGVKAIEKTVVPGWLKWSLIGVGILVVLLAGGGYILRSQVRFRTKELMEEVRQRRRAEEKYSNLIEQCNDGVIVIQDGLLQFANTKMLEISGFTLEEAIGKSFLDFVTPEFKDIVMENYRKRILGEEALSKYDIEMVTKDGRHTPVEINANRIEYEGKPADMAIVRDITERKQAEEKIRHSEAFLRSVIDNSPSAMWVSDSSGTLIEINRACLELLHITEEEVVGKYNILKDDVVEKQGFMPLVREVFDKGKTVEFTMTYDSSQLKHLELENKVELVLEIIISAVRDSRGKTTNAIIQEIDITERKQAEEAITNEAIRRRILVDGSRDGIVILDQDGKVYETNKKFNEMIGYSSEEVKELYVWDWDYKVPRDKLIDMVKTVDEAGDFFETQHRRKDGTIYDVEISTSAAMFAGQKLIFCVCRDITERKRAEEKIKIFSSATAAAIDSIAITDMKGIITYANAAMEDVHGYGKGEMLGKSVGDITANKETLNEILTALAEEGSWSGEILALKKNKETFPALLSVSTVRDDEGNPIAMMGASRDITELKQAEESIANEAIRRRILVDGSRDGIVILDQDGKVYETNKKFNEMIGYSSEEVKKLHAWDWDYKLSRKQLLDYIRHADEAGEIIETKHRRKDGTVYDVEISNSAAVFAGQKLIFSVCRDITERKRANEALRTSEEKLRLMFEAITDGITIVGVEGEIIQANDAAAHLHGYDKKEELVGKTISEFLPMEEHPEAGGYVRNVTENLTVVDNIVVDLLKKDGETFPAEMSASVIKDISGKPMGLVSVFRDITGRRKMEEHLIVTDRLASIGELASGIAHELNNPLTGVIGLAQLLVERDTPGDIKEDLKLIYSEAQRAAVVVKNMLTFARKHSAEKQPVNLNDVINKTMELRAYEQKINNIETITKLAPDLPRIMADAFQLQQVFLNIIINAEYFMIKEHGKGTLTITTERDGDIVRASLADDGFGIPEEDMGHIFNPFFTTKEVGKGTGLGLSICHGIISNHNGKIYAENNQDGGATFIVELPIEQEKQ